MQAGTAVPSLERVAMTKLKILAVSLAAVSLNACSTDQVRLFKTRRMRETVLVQKLDPDKYKAKEEELRLTLTASLAEGKLFEVSKEAVVARRIQSAWDGSREVLMLRYMLIVNDYNTGHITLADYKRWQNELDGAYEGMLQSKKGLSETVRRMISAMAELAQKELEAETAALRRQEVSVQQEALQEQMQPVLLKARALAEGM